MLKTRMAETLKKGRGVGPWGSLGGVWLPEGVATDWAKGRGRTGRGKILPVIRKTELFQCKTVFPLLENKHNIIIHGGFLF